MTAMTYRNGRPARPGDKVTNLVTGHTGILYDLSDTLSPFNGNGTAANFSDRTISYAAWHSGLTQTESSNHWELVKAFRNSAGGGVP